MLNNVQCRQLVACLPVGCKLHSGLRRLRSQCLRPSRCCRFDPWFAPRCCSFCYKMSNSSKVPKMDKGPSTEGNSNADSQHIISAPEPQHMSNQNLCVFIRERVYIYESVLKNYKFNQRTNYILYRASAAFQLTRNAIASNISDDSVRTRSSSSVNTHTA